MKRDDVNTDATISSFLAHILLLSLCLIYEFSSANRGKDKSERKSVTIATAHVRPLGLRRLRHSRPQSSSLLRMSKPADAVKRGL